MCVRGKNSRKKHRFCSKGMSDWFDEYFQGKNKIPLYCQSLLHNFFTNNSSFFFNSLGMLQTKMLQTFQRKKLLQSPVLQNCFEFHQCCKRQMFQKTIAKFSFFPPTQHMTNSIYLKKGFSSFRYKEISSLDKVFSLLSFSEKLKVNSTSEKMHPTYFFS